MHVRMRLLSAALCLSHAFAFGSTVDSDNQSGRSAASTVDSARPAPSIGTTPGGGPFPSALLSHLPLAFAESCAVARDGSEYHARGLGYHVKLTPDAAVVGLLSSRADPASSGANRTWKTDAVRIRFLGADSHAQARGIDALPGRTNYFRAESSSVPCTDRRSFGRIQYSAIYPGIDLVLNGNAQDQIEYDLMVAPGADPSRIRIHTDTPANIDRTTGDLVIGGVRQHKPVVMQAGSQIDGAFTRISAHEFGFKVGSYDHTRALVIDPVIESREYIGGIGDDTIIGIERTGPTSYSATGTTTSIDFPGASAGSRHGVDGSLTSNAALIPAGLNGAISVYVTERTHLILDINGYFAP